MKAEFVNAFLTPATDVYPKGLGVELTFTQAGAVTGVFTASDLTAIIGVTGKLKRNVFYALTNATSLSIAAIGELANMLTGNATIALSETSYVCDISLLPVLLPMGASVTVTNPQIQAHFTCSLGEMSISVGLTEVAD